MTQILEHLSKTREVCIGDPRAWGEILKQIRGKAKETKAKIVKSTPKPRLKPPKPQFKKREPARLKVTKKGSLRLKFKIHFREESPPPNPRDLAMEGIVDDSKVTTVT